MWIILLSVNQHLQVEHLADLAHLATGDETIHDMFLGMFKNQDLPAIGTMIRVGNLPESEKSARRRLAPPENPLDTKNPHTLEAPQPNEENSEKTGRPVGSHAPQSERYFLRSVVASYAFPARIYQNTGFQEGDVFLKGKASQGRIKKLYENARQGYFNF